MNVNEEDFQKRLDEIGKHYEDCKDAINSAMMWNDSLKKEYGIAINSLLHLRDIAAIAVKQAYQIKDN
jgi:hypothetical protein